MSDIKTGLEPSGADLQASLGTDGAEFPCKVELSLEPLVRFWTEEADEECPAKLAMASFIRKALEGAPELSGTITDPDAITRHEDIVDVLMAAVFAPASWEQEYGAVLIPFHLRAFYTTP